MPDKYTDIDDLAEKLDKLTEAEVTNFIAKTTARELFAAETSLKASQKYLKTPEARAFVKSFLVRIEEEFSARSAPNRRRH